MVTAFIVSVLGTNVLTQWYKKAQAEFGDTEIHVAIAILSLASAIIVTLFGHTETFRAFMEWSLGVFGGAVAAYKFVWKQFGSMGITEADLSS